MAIQAQAPIVPVAVQGGRAAMKKGSAFVRPVRVSVRIGQPIPTTGLTLDDRDVLIEKVRREVELLLSQGSSDGRSSFLGSCVDAISQTDAWQSVRGLWTWACDLGFR